MPGPDPFLGFVEDSLWTRDECVPRIAHKVAAYHDANNRAAIDPAKQRPVKLLNLKPASKGLRELCLEDEDSVRSEDVGIGLSVAHTVPIDELKPYAKLCLRTKLADKELAELPLIRQALPLRSPPAATRRPRCLR